MGDLNQVNRMLIIKRHERDKLVAQSQILAREIRIEELKEEVARCNVDMDAQRKVIETADMNINQQRQEMIKESSGVN